MEIMQEGQDDSANKQDRETVMGSHGEYTVHKKPFLVRLETLFSDIYARILESSSQSTNLAAGLMVCSYVQILSLLCDQRLNLPLDLASWSLVNGVLLVVRVTGIAKLLTVSKLFLCLGYASCGVLIGYVALLYRISHLIDRRWKKAKTLMRVADELTQILYWVLAVPLADVFVNIYSCNEEAAYLGFTCGSIEHIVHLGLFSVCFLIYAGVMIAISILAWSCNPYSGNPYARHNASFEVFYLVFRVCLVISVNLCTSTAYRWVVYICFTVGTAGNVMYYVVKLPYYQKVMADTFACCVLTLMWVGFIALVGECMIVINVREYGQIYILVLGTLVFLAMSGNIADTVKNSWLSSTKHIEIKDENQFLQYMQHIIYLLFNSSLTPYEDLLKYGFVAMHKKECDNPTCPLNNNDELYLPLTGERSKPLARSFMDPIALRFLVSRMYKMNIDRYGQRVNQFAGLGNVSDRSMITVVERTGLTYLMYAYYMMTHIGNYHNASLLLECANYLHSGLQFRHSIKEAKLRIEQFMQAHKQSKRAAGTQCAISTNTAPHIGTLVEDNDEAIQMRDKGVEGNFDPRKVLIFEEYYKRFEVLLIQSAGLHSEFWRELSNDCPSLQVLHDQGSKLIEIANMITAAWTELNSFYRCFIKAEALYGRYLQYVSCMLPEAETHLRNALYDDDDHDTIYAHVNDTMNMMCSGRSVVVVVSAMYKSQGQILKVSDTITNIFGYAKSDVVGKNVRVLMPDCYGEHHNKLMQRYLDTGKARNLDRFASVFALHRSGFLIPVNILIKQYYDADYGSVFTGLITQSRHPREAIVTDNMGMILGMSQGAGQDFGNLSPLFLSENRISIFNFAPELAELAQERDDDFQKLAGHKTCRCLIPRDAAGLVNALRGNKLLQVLANPQKSQHYSPTLSVISKQLSKQHARSSLIEGQYKKAYTNAEEQFFDFEIANFEFPERNVFLKAFFYVSRAPSSRNKKESEGAEVRRCAVLPGFVSYDPAQLRHIRSRAKDPLPGISVNLKGERPKETQPSNSLSQAHSAPQAEIYGPAKNLRPPPEEGLTVAMPTSGENEASRLEQSAMREEQPSMQTLLRPRQMNSQESMGRSRAYTRDNSLHSKKESTSAKELGDERARRQILELRSASISKYHPALVCYLNIALSLSLLVTLVVAIISFACELTLKADIVTFSHNVNQTRMLSVLEIAEATRALVLLSSHNRYNRPMLADATRSAIYNYTALHGNPHNGSSYYAWKQDVLRRAADRLLDVQSAVLWFDVTIADANSARTVNPHNVLLQFLLSRGTTLNDSGLLHSALLMYAAQAYNVHNYTADTINEKELGVAFTIQNGYYNIEENLHELALAIKTNVMLTYETNQKMSLASLVLASTLAAAMVFTLTIFLRKVNRHKNEVLKLLFHISLPLRKQQLTSCLNFKNDVLQLSSQNRDTSDPHRILYQNQDQNINHDQNPNPNPNPKLSPNQTHEDPTEDDRLLPGRQELRSQSSLSPRKYEGYVGEYKGHLLKLLLFAVVEMGYFLQNYLRPESTFNMISLHMDEVVAIKKMAINSYRIYAYTIELLGTNGTTSKQAQPLAQYIEAQIAALLEAVSIVREEHIAHKDEFSAEYHEIFLQFMEKSLCDPQKDGPYSECRTFMSGILEKGLALTTTAYARALSELLHDFVIPPLACRSPEFIQRLLNDFRLIQTEVVCKKYLEPYYMGMLKSLYASIDGLIDSSRAMSYGLFSIMVVYLLFGCTVLLSSILNALKQAMHSASSMLGILPMELILQTPPIKSFLLQSYTEILTHIS